MFINGLKFSNKKVSEKTRYTRYMPPNPCKHWVSCVTRCNAIFFKAQNPKGALGFCVIGLFRYDFMAGSPDVNKYAWQYHPYALASDGLFMAPDVGPDLHVEFAVSLPLFYSYHMFLSF